MHCSKVLVMALVMTAGGLAACATQQGMTVEARMTNPAPPKYRNALAIRSVTGGQAMNVLTVPGVPNEPFKAALESSLAANGYLARAGAPRYQVDAEIQDLQQPLIGLDLEVTAAVNYKVSGAGTAATYPIKATAKATFSDSPIAADRMRIANERAMQQNIRMFMEALR